MRKNITLNILFIFKRINKLSLVSFLVLFNSLYPLDSLNTSIDKGNVPQKAALHIIGKWQILSNNCDVLNCQFYPSCSNYMSRSIIEFGIFNGTVVGLDRIIRCNPAAIGYHLSKDNPRFYPRYSICSRWHALGSPLASPLVGGPLAVRWQLGARDIRASS